MQNSIRLIKEKIVSYQQKSASSNASSTSLKPPTGDDPSEETSDSAEPQTIEGSSSFINIKPLINFTLNAFGLFNDINYEEPFDPNDSKRILHSMFQIWNPRVSKLIYQDDIYPHLPCSCVRLAVGRPGSVRSSRRGSGGRGVSWGAWRPWHTQI